MTNEQFTPSVDLTIFPRVNYLKQFLQRADLRARNGRIYNWAYVPFLDDTEYYPPADGSSCFEPTQFPVDLGPDVSTSPTALYDLRNEGCSPNYFDLNSGSDTVQQQLAIADGQGSNWVTGNSGFVQGGDVIAKTASYTGGVDPVTYRARFRTKVLATDSSWINGPWTTGLPNEKVALTVQITSTTGAIVFQSQATDSSDPSVVLNSNTGTKTVPYPTLTAGTPSIQGQPAVGNTLCCLEPTPSGGAAPYVYTYMWTDAATNSVTFENKYLQDCLVLDSTDVGITYYCQVTITSADQQTVNVATANIGPIV